MVDERDKTGRFVAGHRPYTNGGRKKRETEQRLLDVLRGCVPDAEAKAIIAKSVTDAKTGDAVARKWLFDYLVGAPVQRIAPTNPDGDREYTGMDDDRIEELVAILEAARTRTNPGADEGADPAV